MLCASLLRKKDTMWDPKQINLSEILVFFHSVKEPEIKPTTWEIKTLNKNKTARGGWLLCTQRATISLRLKINTVSDNRNLRQALINIMYKFHYLHIQSNAFHSCSTISQHPPPNIKFKITGPQWKDSVAVWHGRLSTTHSSYQLDCKIQCCTVTQIIV